MQKIWCDNCENEIKQEPDEVNKDNPDWKPAVHVQLIMRIMGKGEYPVHMDLCGRCARLYLHHLKKPMDAD